MSSEKFHSAGTRFNVSTAAAAAADTEAVADKVALAGDDVTLLPAPAAFVFTGAETEIEADGVESSSAVVVEIESNELRSPF